MDFVCESSHFIAEYHESERTCVEEVLTLLRYNRKDRQRAETENDS